MAPLTDSTARFVSYAQNQEDVLLFRALRSVGKGFYVDVGAQDPVGDSVTKAFYDAGWNGINIEPSPFWHSHLQQGRPNDINLLCAAYSIDTELDFFHIPHTGLSTCFPELAAGHAVPRGTESQRLRIPARTLAGILDKCAVRDIHFLKIDAEGAEGHVISGMDFKRWRPWIVLVEAIHPDTHEPTHCEWESGLLDASYSFAFFDGVNRFYVAAEHPELRAHFTAPASALDHFVRHRELIAVSRDREPVAEARPGLPAGFGINLIGQFSSSTGLGISARHLARSLARGGIPLALFDDPPSYGHAHDADPTLAGLMATDPDRLPHPINLYVTYAGGIEPCLARYPALLRPGRFHAALIWWETTALPADWAVHLARLDAIVCFSGFIRYSLANLIPLTPILEGMQPIEPPAPLEVTRAQLGIPGDATLFVGSFDPQGDPARKNPAAMVLAFRQAFPARSENARLLVRVNHADASRFGQAALLQMEQAAEGDPRVGFLQGPLSQAELHGLFQCADVYVSLHRAEGLGLGMLEAMAMTKPVIATAWSGNLSFMDPSSACLVRYRPIPVNGNYGSYRPEALGQGAIWAEPVTEDAAAWMRALHASPQLRQRIGSDAYRHFLRHRQQADQLEWLRQLAQVWETVAMLPSVTGKFSAAGNT